MRRRWVLGIGPLNSHLLPAGRSADSHSLTKRAFGKRYSLFWVHGGHSSSLDSETGTLLCKGEISRDFKLEENSGETSFPRQASTQQRQQHLTGSESSLRTDRPHGSQSCSAGLELHLPPSLLILAVADVAIIMQHLLPFRYDVRKSHLNLIHIRDLESRLEM